jgi:hypothetical protein
MTVVLYHFTCSHGHAAITETGVVLPASLAAPDIEWDELGDHRWIADHSWFTDQPDGLGSGLNHRTTSGCDRLTYRWRVTDPTNVNRFNDTGRVLPYAVRLELITRPDVMAGTWWCATEPVPVTYDPERTPL